MTTIPTDIHDADATWDRSYADGADASIWAELPFVGDALDALRARERGPLLEVPCGGGRNTIPLARGASFVTAVDRSAAALATAARALARAGVANSLLVRGDVHALPFPDATFGSVLCADLLAHLHRPQEALAELLRVVEPGGRIYANLFGTEDSTRHDPGARPVADQACVFRDVYFRYYDAAAVRETVCVPGARVLALDELRWSEDPHPGYRDYPHAHHSHLVLLERI
jgi:ubiquinone/menaquinone biosynthesis C-methylase UbiE